MVLLGYENDSKRDANFSRIIYDFYPSFLERYSLILVIIMLFLLYNFLLLAYANKLINSILLSFYWLFEHGGTSCSYFRKYKTNE